MKTLKKGKKFKRLKNRSKDDMDKIRDLMSEGWEFCDKTTWRKLKDGKSEESPDGDGEQASS